MMAALQTPKNRSSPEMMSSRYRLFRALMRLLGRIFLGFAVHGEENMPPKGAVVVAANHTQYLDPVYVGETPGLRARLRGERLRVYVGPPMTVDGTLRGREAYRAAADEVLRAIYALPEQSARESRW